MDSNGQSFSSTLPYNDTYLLSSSVTRQDLLIRNLTTTLEYVLTRDIIVWKLNEKEFEINFPCIVCLLFAIAIGVFGNGCVIYVFGFRFKRNNTNLFTTWLSVYDLFTNFLLVFEVFDKRFPMYSGNYVVLCKAIRLFIIITNASSAFLLLGIAFDRYFKVCTPLKRMSVKTSRRVIIAGLISPFICVWPMAIFHGPEKRRTVYTDIYGVDCADDDTYVDTASRKVFYSFLVLVIICSIIILFVLYVKIFIAIRKWKRFGDTLRKRKSDVVTKSFQNTLNSGNESLNTLRGDEENGNAMRNINTNSTTNKPHRTVHSISLQVDSKLEDVQAGESDAASIHQNYAKSRNEMPSSKMKRTNGLGRSRRRTMSITTFMFSLVSILYVCSFLPTVTVEALNALKVFNLSELSFTEKQLIVIANISYFLNGSFNPVIYISCNKHFRDEIRCIFYSNRH